MIWTTQKIEDYNDLGRIQWERNLKLRNLLDGEELPIKNPYYLNQEGVRNSGIEFEFTEEEKIHYINVSNNPHQFIELKRLFVPYLKLQSSQKDMLDNLINSRFNIFHTSRQIGITTISNLYSLFYALFNSKKTIMILSDRSSKRSDNFNLVFTFYKSLPYYLKCGVDSYRSGDFLKFENGSRIYFRSPLSPIGQNIDLLIIDDFAYFDKKSSKNVLQSILPVMMSLSNSKVLIYSSISNNRKNHFTDLINDPKIFKVSTYPWDCIYRKEYDKFKQERISAIGEESFWYEYECILPGKQMNRHLKLKQLNID